MLTSTEITKLLAQVNIAFTEDRDRIKALEAKVTKIEADYTVKAPKGATKNVEWTRIRNNDVNYSLYRR
jgi:hypothetical protein